MEVMDEIAIERYPAYKNSGVKWLGEIPEHWRVRRIKSVIESECNGIWGNDPTEECDTFCIRVSDFDRNLLKVSILKLTLREINTDDFFSRSIKRGDLLIEKSGGGDKTLVGQVVLFEHDIKAVCSNFVGRLRLNKEAESCFMNYLFNALYLNSINYKHIKQTTGIQNLDTSSYFNESIALPPIEEQTAIARFLDAKTALIDKAIAIKEKQIELLKERQQILIHRAVTRGLNSKVKFKESSVEWIGEIPEHWEVVKNRSLFVEINLPGNEYLPILSVSIHTAVSSEELNEEDNLRGKIRIEDKSAYKLVRPGFVVFNMMRAWQGAIGCVNTNGMVSPAYIVAEPNHLIDSTFFEYMYRTDAFIQQMDRYSKGITDFRKRLYWNEFKQLITLLPPIKDQLEIIKFIKKTSEKMNIVIEKKVQEIQKIKEYKSSLINSTVTGKIKVC